MTLFEYFELLLSAQILVFFVDRPFLILKRSLKSRFGIDLRRKHPIPVGIAEDRRKLRKQIEKSINLLTVSGLDQRLMKNRGYSRMQFQIPESSPPNVFEK